MKLINAINKVKSQDTTRNAISKIYLDSVNQRIVATDGNIMAVLNPSEAIKESTCLDVPKMSGKVLDINLDDLTATNEAGLSAKCSKIEATFPQWKNVVPSDDISLELCLDASLLLKLVESLSSSKDTRIKLSIVSNTQAIKVTNTQTNNEGYIMPLYPESFDKCRDKIQQKDY